MRACISAVFVVAAWLQLIVSCADAQTPLQAPLNQRREVVIAGHQMEKIRAQLLGVFRDHASFDPANAARMEIQTNSGLATVEFRSGEGRLLVDGNARATVEIARLVAILSQPAGGTALRALPLSNNGQASLEQSSLLGGKRQPASSPFGLPSFSASNGSLATPSRLTAAQQDGVPATGGQAGGQNNSQPDEPAADQSPLPLQPFEGVQVEMLPEIDAIILRGRDQQLQDLAEIIKRLDEASQQAQPIIEIIPLQHTAAESVATLITQTQTGLLGTRQGRANVTPLDKPNAMLVIGWGEALVVVKELISKLDVPVQADTQFAIRQLRHARATDVQTQLRSFFLSRGGLSPTIQSTIDSRTNAIIIHASPRDLQEVQALLDQLDVPRGEAMQQARVFEIRYSLASDIAQSLQTALAASATGNQVSLQLVDKDGKPLATSGILGNSQITINDRNNTLIISSAPENLELIARLIEQLDTPGMVAKIKIFPIQNGDAGDMVQMLRSLIPSQTPGTTGSPQLSSSPDEVSLVPLRFTVDGRGNNIIAVGSEGDLSIVEALVIRLDESDTMQRKSTVYQLKNSPAVDVALAVNEFLRSKRNVENIVPQSTNPFAQIEKEVVVVPEPVQNKLILSATPRYYEEVARLIEQLDQQPPQVMIQVLIAEIILGDTDEFGVELGLQNSVLFDRSLLGDLLTRTNTTTPGGGIVTSTVQDIVSATNIPGFDFNNTQPLGNSGSASALRGAGQVGGQGISNFAVGRGNDTAGFGGLVLSASSENVTFLLRALQENRRLEILSRPQVLTLDNQQAFIQVGQRVPRIVNSTINQNGAQNSVTLENVGLIVGVTPRISPENNVVMEIDAEKSEVGPESEGIPVSVSANGTEIRSPRIDTVTAQATVSAANGETIILGGLISRKTSTIHRQVPWLGDIPVIKHLFSYDYFDMKRTELLIIMTPHVIRSAGDMEQLKQAEFARMSWCEADVFAIHGDVYPTTNLSTETFDGIDCNVVYPDVDPRGLLPGTIDEAIPYSTEPLPVEASPLPSPGLPGRSEVVPVPAGQSGSSPKRSGGPLAAVDLPTVPHSYASQFGSTSTVVTASATSPITASPTGATVIKPRTPTPPSDESQKTIGGAR